MNTTVIEKKFQDMGARVKITEAQDTRWQTGQPFRINIRKDKEGEFFDIQVKNEVEMLVLDVQKHDKHLLLMAKDYTNNKTRNGFPASEKVAPKARFLCGHDERNWFTCAVPGGASNVFQAKQALKPARLRDIESKEGLKTNRAQKRHRKLNSGRKIHRQGEFMFIPEYNYKPPTGSLVIIHRHEPMSRGGGNSHFAEYLYRSGGEKVYVSRSVAPNGFTEKEYQDWLKNNPDQKWIHWEFRVRNPEVYVKGRITHKEHRTLDLGDIWHRVMLNAEIKSNSVAFID
jgi:hypothetical protein